MILFAYNRQRQVTSVTDQAGTVHAYDYDKLGRQTQDRVTTLGTGVDGAVRRIETGYEVRGMKARITSFDNPTIGGGSVLNESTFVYNNYGQVASVFQAHAGTVNVATSPKVQYGYANGSANTIRPTSVTYPNGRVVTYDYAGAGSVSDRSSRIAALKEGSATLASYSYLGRQTFVEQDNPEPDVRWTLVDLAGSNDPDTDDIYSGLDRFGRVKDHRWRNDGTSTDTDRIQYGYDRAGNRIWRKNPVADALGKRYDELYGYDAAQRLKTMDRGTISGSSLTNPTFAQCWTLDPTGNWKGFREDNDGNGTWDLVQARTANAVNEITDIANTTGTAWIDPAYSRAGNMTTMPRPSDPTQSYTATYDAWNRLVKLAAGATTVSEYQYDGAKRRIVQKTFSNGSLTETRHYYCTEPAKWQVLEERLGTSPDSAAAERQFVWGLRYIDDLIVRDRDTDNSGSLDERLYACQDANWNVTAVVSATGTVQERYAYTAYGQPMYLTATFAGRTTSSHAWETLYCGYRYEAGTGLFHVRHRVLHPIVGVWVQRDPLKRFLTHDAYVYADAHALERTDPTGLDAWSTLYGIGEGAVGFGQGLAQGGLNILNGLQDAVIAVPNVIPLSWNATAGNLGAPTIGYIPSPNWSENLITQNDPTHEWSRFIGGQGPMLLCTLGASQIGSSSNLRHITSPANAASIGSSEFISGSGGVYATGGGHIQASVANIITLPNVGASVPISSAALPAFRPIPVIGPISAANRWGACGYWAPYSCVNLTTGATVPISGVAGYWPLATDAIMGAGLQYGIQSQMGTTPSWNRNSGAPRF